MRMLEPFFLAMGTNKVPVTIQTLIHYVNHLPRTPAFITCSFLRFEITIPPDFNRMQGMRMPHIKTCTPLAEFEIAGRTELRFSTVDHPSAIATDLIPMYEVLGFTM